MAIYFADGTSQSTAGGGKILQVKQTVHSSQIESGYANLTDLMSVNITPSSSSNKILVMVNCAGAGSRSTDTVWRMYLYRDGSYIYGVDTYVGDSASGGNSSNPNAMYLDSPSTTSQITYKVSGERVGGSSNCVFNHSDGNADSSITVMEVAA
jgi:hypothetical protein|tara:strand:+ start:43 stop:501 length:459 start_codon:yes stop_codon:yes gene_type:complete